ncbi:MAG: DUF502 domain-containing protein [Candidatus Marinimicrobia bacterium]|nr:DUF502 domain-containing protein [Candidatus Neomarinimicrobiota bacterium]
MSSFLKKVRVQIRNKILTGVLALIPIAVTIYLIRLFVEFFDNIVSPIIDPYIGFHIPGLGIVVFFIILYILGLFVSNLLGKKLLLLIEKWLNYIPIAGTIYRTAKQIVYAFSVQGKGFEKVVFIEYPRSGIWTIAFVTGESVGKDGAEFYNLFVPTTPNPTSGWALFIPKEDVIPSEMTIEQGLKALISGGAVAPQKMSFIRKNKKGNE